jgi:hypothetical protein
MNKKLSIGFTDTHPHLATFFMDLLSTRYDVEINNDNPDFLLFGDRNFGENNLKYSKDVVKIFYTGENQRPEDYDCNYAISFDHNFEPWHYRLPLYVVYMWALEHIHKTKYDFNYIFNPEIKEKTDFCSFVVSNPNCQERNNFFKMLHKEKHVDSAGKLYKNIDVNLEGEAAKIEFLSTRKFNICFEPYSHPGYVTEKILHAFYAGTIPIYWGSETISSDFNPNAFIDVNDFSSYEEAIKFIMYLDSNDELYNIMLNAPKFKNGIPPSYIMLDNFLNWFDAVVYNKILQR